MTLAVALGQSRKGIDMSDLGTEIWKKYGIRALVFAAIFSLVLWVIAHRTAAPGGTVSVLWGLVEYTKATDGPPIRVEDEPTQIVDKTVPSPKALNPKADHEIIEVERQGRIYLNMRPKQMLESVANMTQIQSTLFEEQTYGGKWMRIRGPIGEVFGASAYAWLVFNIDGVTTRVFMSDEYVDRVTHLNIGDVVTVDGLFKSMDNVGPDFENGEIVLSDGD